MVCFARAVIDRFTSPEANRIIFRDGIHESHRASPAHASSTRAIFLDSRFVWVSFLLSVNCNILCSRVHTKHVAFSSFFCLHRLSILRCVESLWMRYVVVVVYSNLSYNLYTFGRNYEKCSRPSGKWTKKKRFFTGDDNGEENSEKESKKKECINRIGCIACIVHRARIRDGALYAVDDAVAIVSNVLGRALARSLSAGWLASKPKWNTRSTPNRLFTARNTLTQKGIDGSISATTTTRKRRKKKSHNKNSAMPGIWNWCDYWRADSVGMAILLD